VRAINISLYRSSKYTTVVGLILILLPLGGIIYYSFFWGGSPARPPYIIKRFSNRRSKYLIKYTRESRLVEY
jgi:hypothetical protein